MLLDLVEYRKAIDLVLLVLSIVKVVIIYNVMHFKALRENMDQIQCWKRNNDIF